MEVRDEAEAGIQLRTWPGPGETLDVLCGGRVRLIQRAHGYRVALDPILLAHFAAPEARGPAIDLGTGSAIIPLILALKFGHAALTGLELQPRLYALARRNVRLNGCEDRIALALGDLREVRRTFPRAAFGHVLCNPPYGSVTRGLRNPEQEKALARHGICCRVEDVAAAASWLLRERGLLSVIFPAPRLAELLVALRAMNLEPRRLRLVHPRAGRPAKWSLLTAAKGAGPGLTVLPPLQVHPAQGPGFTDEIRHMLA